MKLSLPHPSSRLMLGITLGPGQLRVAEVAARGDRLRIERHAALATDEEQSPAAIGAALGSLLRAEGFKARRAIVGLPAQWLVQRSHTVPPADEATTANLLRLAAEREFAADAGQWRLDAHLSGGVGNVLVLGAPMSRLAEVQAIMAAAGVKLMGITATAAAVMQMQVADAGDVAMLLMEPGGGGELVIGRGNRLAGTEQLVRSSGVELKRALTVSGLRLQVRPAELLIWSDSADDCTATAVGDLKVQPRPAPSVLGLDPEATHSAAPGIAIAAAAVAATGMAGRKPAVDLLHSKLAVSKPTFVTRKRIIAGVATVAAAIVLLAFMQDWRNQQAAVDELRAAIAALEPQVDAATEHVARRRLASGWYERRPPFLDAMLGLTRLVSNSGTVWATSLTLRDDMSGALSGKASGERDILTLLESLKASPLFQEVRLAYMRQEDRAGTIAFALTFGLADEEPEP